ncbi:U3 small nucleolar RNA-associated protein 4 [Cyphellophora attinorum]|uniref:U3 small nucleolar RNA-associated protein 4 n=1 Tax=Cyphellophora attinorum TaxID=1664694 RepID=A0A0N0NS86_9EURO|nr:U3 small nucleolar RNA-associated protein 4 [Phialophora attinorum]KPI45968.1 U3 small nucleolar RNA-associated protein 4 [Phialophora attinorum]
MDIHRCRFVPYPPPSISAVAFSHQSDISRQAPKDLRLAVGRENGDVELWNPDNGRWSQESVLRGSVGSSIDQLAWTQDITVEDNGDRRSIKAGRLRLFSSGAGIISECSLSAGSQARRADSNFGEVWCFAAQPPYRASKSEQVPDDIPSQLLVAGCQSGDIVLFSTTDGELRSQQLLCPASTKKSKVLSITWRDRNTVVAGYEDGLIRVLDIRSRKVLRQMSLGKTSEGSTCVVWSVKCLSDGTIVSGDSSGELKIWDANNFSLVQRLKSHQADVLDITSNVKGDQIYSVGVDRRTVAYQAIPMQPGQKKRKWAEAMHRRYHDHDTKCAASYESQGFSVLVSGGMDASPMLLPMRNWQSENHRSLPHLPQQPQLSTSRNRLLLTWWSNELHIYEVPPRQDDGELSLARDDYDLLTTIRLKDEHHIQSAQLSRDGRYIIASTSKAVRLFQVRRSVVDGISIARSRSVQLPTPLQDHGARHVGISPDGRWLFAVRFDSTVIVVKLLAGSDPKSAPTIHAQMARLSPTSSEDDDERFGNYINQISTVQMSADSRVLVTGDLSGHITAWTLEGHEDTSTTLDAPTDKSSNSSSSGSSSSDSDDDEDDDTPTIHAQRWTRAATFPRLDSSILSLCIRQAGPSPNTSPQSPKQPTNIALHPTRHNPHPLANEHPTPNTTILALTADHSLVELSVITGKLSDWSRRNPSSLLPIRFRNIRDRAMDMFLHGNRLWMYGCSWVYMLDLSHDFPVPTTSSDYGEGVLATANEKKRKRITAAAAAKGTGAGSRILNHRKRPVSGLAAPTGIKYKGEQGMLEVVDLEGRMAPAEDDDAFGEEEALGALVKMRRDEGVEANGTSRTNDGRKGSGRNGDNEGEGPIEYATFRYRAIFGIGVLGNDSDGLDLPPRPTPT